MRVVTRDRADPGRAQQRASLGGRRRGPLEITDPELIRQDTDEHAETRVRPTRGLGALQRAPHPDGHVAMLRLPIHERE